MKWSCAPSSRSWSPSLWGCSLSMLVAFSTTVVQADPPQNVVRVEEDWHLQVNEPELVNNSPQVTCTMSPVGDVDHEYITFEMNHQSQPGYDVGGLHLHAWNGDFLLTSAHTQETVTLNTEHEALTWTQAMSLSDGCLTYSVIHGVSSTWGAFGGAELSVAMASSLENLDTYDYEISVSGTGVGYGANRVASLVLKKVRYFTAGGDVVEVDVNRNILAE